MPGYAGRQGRRPCTGSGGGLLALLVLLALLISAPGRASAAEPDAQPADSGWRTVSNRTLSHMRGGFDVGGGLLVNFGITRAVYVNGALVTESMLNVADLSRLDAAQAARLHAQMSELKLVQNGPGNTAPADLASLRHGLVIQNTLNNQSIHVQTILNASSNGLSMVRTLNLQGAIDDAVQRAVGPR